MAFLANRFGSVLCIVMTMYLLVSRGVSAQEDCVESIDGGNWQLVRHTYNKWFSATDSLIGTADYGDITGPLSNNEFAIPFEATDDTEFLFSFDGCDKWLITTYYQFAYTWGSYYAATILKSHTSDVPYTAHWYNRGGNVACEDPWISWADYSASSIIYGECNIAGNTVYSGRYLNVWMRGGADSQCDSANISAVNWHDMFHGDGDEGDLLQNYAVNFDSAGFSLTVSATVEYVGLSSDGNTDEAFNLGTTYWIDFQSFAGISDGITTAGSCGNRLAADYSGLDFSEFWNYTVDPSDLESALTAERMAYPASDWNLTSLDCNTVKYEKTFSLAELTTCTDADGETLVNVEESNDTISFQGTLFVELVSPYSMSSSDYYRTFSLLQYEFDIQLGRSVDVLSSTGVLLFSSSATGIGHDDDGNYVLRILTQSADFISLDAGAVVAAPVVDSGITIEEETSSCFVHSSNVCGQIFVVTIPSDVDCTVSDGEEVIDLSGTFQMAFTPQCREIDGSVEDMCTAWIDSLDDSGSLVLDLDWQFVDKTCGVNLFDATFSADLAFYSDDQFSTAVADDGAFVIAQDTIYGEVEVTVPSDDGSGDELYDLVEVSIENVFVCTSDDDTDLSSTLSASDGSGGCLSSDVDVDGLYTVIGSGANTEYQGETAYDASANNVVRFSFLAFETARTTISVHVGVLLTVQTDTGRRRLRMLLEDVGSNQIRHFIGSTNVAQPAEEGFAMEMVVGTGIGGAVIVGIMVFVVMLLAKKRKSGSVVKEPAMTTAVPSQNNTITAPSTSVIVTV